MALPVSVGRTGQHFGSRNRSPLDRQTKTQGVERLDPPYPEEVLVMATRLSVNINDEVAGALRELASDDDTTVTEIVRRAVSVYKFFQDQNRDGKSIQLVDNQERVEAVHLV